MVTNSVLFSKSRYPVAGGTQAKMHGSDVNPSEFDHMVVSHILDTDIHSPKKIL